MSQTVKHSFAISKASSSSCRIFSIVSAENSLLTLFVSSVSRRSLLSKLPIITYWLVLQFPAQAVLISDFTWPFVMMRDSLHGQLLCSHRNFNEFGVPLMPINSVGALVKKIRKSFVAVLPLCFTLDSFFNLLRAFVNRLGTNILNVFA